MKDLSRDRFEEWILKKAKDLNYSYMDMVLKRFENGDYRTTWVDMAWIGWSGSMAEVDRLSSENRELLKFKEHMVELREAHGFDSWAAALVEVDKLRAEVERIKSLNHQQFGDAIRKNAEIEALKRGMVGDYDLDAWLEFSTGAVQKDADRHRWLRRHEFDIGSYHAVQEHNHQAWFEHISDESIDRCIADEAEFAAQFEVKS